MSQGSMPWTQQFLNNGLSLVSPGRDKLQILIYHRVLPQFDPLQPDIVTIEIFQEQIKLLSKFFNVLPLDHAIDLLERRKLPPKSICITFDDGYRDNVENALPILKKYNVKAAFFIATGFLHGRVMFNDRIIEHVRYTQEDWLDLSDYALGHYHVESLAQKYSAINKILTKLKHLPYHDRYQICEQLCGPIDEKMAKLMMRPHHVKTLSEEGMIIGGHTVNHPILSCMPIAQAKEEILVGKQELEQIIGRKVDYFAYPNGKPNKDFNDQHAQWVRQCGYKAAMSTQWGVASSKSDRYQLPRFTPWDKKPLKFMLRLIQYRHRTETV